MIKIIKIQFYKYEHMVVQFMCECFIFSASSWLILVNKYIEKHGQQNIKIFFFYLHLGFPRSLFRLG